MNGIEVNNFVWVRATEQVGRVVGTVRLSGNDVFLVAYKDGWETLRYADELQRLVSR